MGLRVESLGVRKYRGDQWTNYTARKMIRIPRNRTKSPAVKPSQNFLHHAAARLSGQSLGIIAPP